MDGTRQIKIVKIVEEMRQRCRFAKLAWQGLRTVLNRMDNEGAFFYVHGLLDHAGAVGRTLSASEGEARETASRMVELLGIKEANPLLSRELKFFAEADETQFERWLSGLDHYRYLGMNVMPRGATADFIQDTFLRSLDPEVYEFSWYDRSIDLQELMKALQQVESKAEAWLKRQ